MYTAGRLQLRISGVLSLEDLLHRYDVYDPDFYGFLKAMLQILPDDRKSAKQLLEHRWIAQN